MPSPYVSNAEFSRFTEYMGGQFLGGPALTRHLFNDIGKIDAQGRPEQGCSIWWFVAHLEPTSTKTSLVRDDLIDALKRGHLGRDEVVKTAWQLIGDARALVNDGPTAARVSEFGFSGDKAKYMDQRGALLKMLDAAETTVRRWAEDPSYRGNSYFYARPASGQEFTSKKYALEGPNARKYSTTDDQALQGGPTVKDRIKTLGDPKPTFWTAKDTSNAKASSARKPSTASQPAQASAASKIAGLAQSDAVKVMLATDVIDFAAGDGLDAALLEEMGNGVGDDVAKFFHGDQAAAKRKFLGPALTEATKAYANKDAASARAEASTLLASLGVSASQVRSFRNKLAAGLTAATIEPAATQVAPTTGQPYSARAADMQALADAVKSAKHISAEQVEALAEIVYSLDLATIYDQTPSLQDHFQMTFCYHAGMDGPQTEALTDLYWHALNGHRDIIKNNAAKSGHIPFSEGREKIVKIMNTYSADNAPSPGVLDDFKSVVASIDPKALDKGKRNDVASMVCVVAFYAEPGLQTKLRAYADELNK